jgi:hypothetical protein
MANGFAAGLAGGLEGLVEFLKYRQGQKRLDVEQQRQQSIQDRENRESQLRMEQIRQAMETSKLQQEQARLALADQPRKLALDVFKTNVEAKGVEGALDDPQALNQATRAGISLPHKPYLMPHEGFSQGEADAGNELMGLFPNSGIVKPPEILEAEAKRDLGVQKSRFLTNIMRGMSNGAQAGQGNTPFSDSPQNRIIMEMLGISPTSTFGPVRETPEEAAAKASAVAVAKAPHQQALIDYAAKNRINLNGDPYFNEALRTISSVIPPVNEQMAEMVVKAAQAMASRAQAVQPRGQAGPPTGTPQPSPTAPPAGGGGAPTPETVLLQMSQKLGGNWAAVEAELSKPDVQARSKQLGLDPAALLQKARAYKILERMKGASAPKQ